MKKLRLFIIFAGALFIVAAGSHLMYLRSLAPQESYPNDTFLSKETNKTALIIMAHDDDAVGSSGTIAGLCDNGWSVREMCFYQQAGLYFQKDSAKNPKRKKALATVAKMQGMQGVDPVDFNFRRDTTTEAAYMPMPYASFATNYHMDSLRTIIGKYIEQYKPSIIFSLDNIMGGYGHPDHTLIGQLVVEYCRLHKSDPGFSVKKIYQPVFPPSIAEKVLGKLPVYGAAKKVYGVTGMPLPDVQVDISGYAKTKKQAMQTYTTEQNSLRKIWPYYHWYPSWIYFRIFDRDFYRVLDVSSL